MLSSGVSGNPSSKISRAVVNVEDSDLEPKYNQGYISTRLKNVNRGSLMVQFRPKKKSLKLRIQLQRNEETESGLSTSGIELEQRAYSKDYDLGVTSVDDVDENAEMLRDFFREVFCELRGDQVAAFRVLESH